MQRRILAIFLILLIPNLTFAQAKVSVYKNVNKSKYSPKLPNFFEGEKPRGELISVGSIVATKASSDNSGSDDSFSVASSTDKPVMGNPLGILPKKNVEVIKQEPEEPKDENTRQLEAAVSEARNVAEQIRKTVGDNVDYTNVKDIGRVVDASQKALQRGQLSNPKQEVEKQEQDYKF